MGNCSGLYHRDDSAESSAYGKLPAHKSAPHLHGRDCRGRGLTDFGTRICQAIVMVSFRAKAVRLEKVPVESGRLAG